MNKKYYFACFSKSFIMVVLGVVGSVNIFCARMSYGETGYGVWGEFENALKVPPAVNNPVDVSTSATMFNGHNKDYSIPGSGQPSSVPSGGGYLLQQSSFGQAVSFSIPYPDFQIAAITYAKKKLYYEESEPTDVNGFGKDMAAFRYRVLMYEAAGADIEQKPESLASVWTIIEQERALDAMAKVRFALRYDPWNTDLRKLLLDIYYDTAAANLAAAQDLMCEEQKAVLRLSPYANPTDNKSINTEIKIIHGTAPKYEDGALALFDEARRYYFNLLKDPMGIDMHLVDQESADAGIPFGYYLFKTLVPDRSLYSASYLAPGTKENDPVIKPIVDDNNDNQPDILFTGYKDIVLLFNIESEAARAAAKLAKLYAMRGNTGDVDKARAIIGHIQQQSYTDGTILEGLITNTPDDNSGLITARAGWRQALSAMSNLHAFLDGNNNPIGLDKDFLALVQTPFVSSQDSHEDSYDFFKKLLLPDGSTPSGPLGVAFQKYTKACDDYKTFRTSQDTIGGELEGLRSKFGDRLTRIAGAARESSEYATPEDNQGGEIYIQLESIKLAQLRMKHNEAEIKVLQGQVNNEIERRGKENNINDLIAKTYLKYGDKQEALTKELGWISGQQAISNNVAAACNSATWWGAMGNGINAAVQGVGEVMKGLIQAQKERLQALQTAEITYLSDRISAANSEARVKDLLLGMLTLTIESSEAAVSLEQDLGRLENLYTEKAYLETRWDEAKKALGNRYFADPSHRLVMNQSIAEADTAFDVAQVWVFILARALEYKWNTPLTASGYTGLNYTPSSVFSLRNAQELLNMAQALSEKDNTLTVGTRGGTQFVKFSLKEDFLGFRSSVGNGLYPDPKDGTLVSAQKAFQSYLANIVPQGEPTESGIIAEKVLHIEFSTNKENLAGNFFSVGRWNEKIRWISVKINATGAPVNELQVYLGQRGTAYIRNQTRGTTPDINHPDRITGEMTAYPVKYWYAENNEWKSKDKFGFGINAVITTDPNAPLESAQKSEFFEMSPAVSNWVLEIPLRKNSIDVLDVNKISDIEIWFYNKYYTRNNKTE